MATKVFVFIQLQGFEASMVATSQAIQEFLVHQHLHGESKQNQFFSIAQPCQF